MCPFLFQIVKVCKKDETSLAQQSLPIDEVLIEIIVCSPMFDTIENALRDLAEGKVVIVVDDADRENEGDFIIPAEKVTAETINFMSKYGRGLICTPISESRALELNFMPMVIATDKGNQAAFTVSVDSIHGGSGISAKDRALTVKSIVDDNATADHFHRPGHTFPLIARDGGVLVRRGHTEAAVDLARLSGHKPAAVLCEILDDDGETASYDHLQKLAMIFRLKIITVEDLVRYRESRKQFANDITL